MKSTRRTGRFRTRWTVAFAACALAAGCSGGKPAPGASADLRVPECEEYGRRMAECFDRDELATSMPTMARDENHRERMRLACSQSLGQLTLACR